MDTRKTPEMDDDQVEGRNPVMEAIRGPREVKTIYLARNVERTGVIVRIVAAAGSEKIPIIEIDKAELSRIASTAAPQGVVARVSPFIYIGLDELVAGLETRKTPLLLALDGVEDPRNLGSLLRVADAAGVDGVIIPRRRACQVTPAVNSASAGAVEHVRVVSVANIANSLVRLKKEGFWVVGADAESGGLYCELDLSGPLVMVLGGEGKGLGRLVKERCDFLARLPMAGKVSSLNVATAGAVLLFEALRQRTTDGGRS